ncbi:hypothetical protein Aperf_G00000095169 [Anoplocephala perfoliata]
MAAAEAPTNGVATKLKKANDVRLELGELTVHNVNQLRVINRTVFPPQLCRLAYFNDIVVGAVCYRFEKVEGSDNLKKCYIMTLGCLAPYRRYGVGSLLLRHVLRKCAKNKQITSKIENYYHRLSPQDAYILEKQLDHSVPIDDSDSD